MSEDEPKPVCRCCRVDTQVSDPEVRRILELMAQGVELSLVSEEEYASRLAACRECKHLDGGTTCRQSGGLVAVTARLADRHCPDPDGARW